jgi:hypothetical protein
MSLKETVHQLFKNKSRFMITIKKAKLTSLAGLEVEFEEKITTAEGETFTIEGTKKCTYSPHSDLYGRFDRLKIHLAALCEQVSEAELADQREDHPALGKLKVTGFAIGGENEHEGVTLIGRKGLANNRVLNLVSPFTKWEDEHNGYKWSYELGSIIQECQSEVEQYLDGKKAPKVQLELGLNEAIDA